MLSNPLSLTTKQYSILGRLVATQQPDVAKQLWSIYDNKPQEQDHAKVLPYFTTFCLLHDINPEDYTGPLFKTSKVDWRRLFIACMVRIYQPHVYAAPAGCLRFDKGFIKALSDTLKQKPTNVSKAVRQGVVHEKAYSEFKAAVDEITSKLISS